MWLKTGPRISADIQGPIFCSASFFGSNHSSCKTASVKFLRQCRYFFSLFSENKGSCPPILISLSGIGRWKTSSKKVCKMGREIVPTIDSSKYDFSMLFLAFSNGEKTGANILSENRRIFTKHYLPFLYFEDLPAILPIAQGRKVIKQRIYAAYKIKAILRILSTDHMHTNLFVSWSDRKLFELTHLVPHRRNVPCDSSHDDVIYMIGSGGYRAFRVNCSFPPLFQPFHLFTFTLDFLSSFFPTGKRKVFSLSLSLSFLVLESRSNAGWNRRRAWKERRRRHERIEFGEGKWK